MPLVNLSETPHPNPPPSRSLDLLIGIYAAVGALSIMLWDIMDNVRMDYLLLTRFPIRLPTVAYLVSRTTTLAFSIAATLFLTAPTEQCSAMALASSWLSAASISSTSLLFLLRVSAVYNRKRPITAFFIFLWLTVVGSSVALPLVSNIALTRAGSSGYCVPRSTKHFLVWAGTTFFVYDSSVFIAISWRLLQVSEYESSSFFQRVRIVIYGTTFPKFTRSLLRDGQQYYLLSILTTIMNLVLGTYPVMPDAYRTLGGCLTLVLGHIWTCRVFRHTKFGVFREDLDVSRGGVAGFVQQSPQGKEQGPLVFEYPIPSTGDLEAPPNIHSRAT